MLRVSTVLLIASLLSVSVAAQEAAGQERAAEQESTATRQDGASPDDVRNLLQPVDVPGGSLSLAELLVIPPERTPPPQGACLASASTTIAPAAQVTAAAPSVQLGTAHPLWVQRIASDGSWVAACQAREDSDGDGNIRVYFGHHGGVGGDEGTLYLMHAGAPEGMPIDEVLAQDPRTSRVVVRKGRDVLMLHLTSGEEVRLHRSPRSRRGQAVATIREARFSGDGNELLYVLDDGSGSTSLVVRDVATNEERSVSVGEGYVIQAALAGGGAYVSTALVTADTDGDGELGAYMRTNLVSGPCSGPALSSSSYGQGGDVVVTRFVRRCDDEVFEGQVIAVTRAGLVVRNEDLSLSWHHVEGDVTPIVPAVCRARVLEVDVQARAVEVSCGRTGDHGVRLRFAPGVARRVGFLGRVFAHDQVRVIEAPRTPSPEPRFQLRPHGLQNIGIVDTQTGEVRRLMSSRDASVRPLGRYQSLQRHTVGSVSMMGVDMVELGPALVLDMRGEDGVTVLGELPAAPLEIVAGEVGLVYPTPRPTGRRGARSGPIQWMPITASSSWAEGCPNPHTGVTLEGESAVSPPREVAR